MLFNKLRIFRANGEDVCESERKGSDLLNNNFTQRIEEEPDN